MESREKTLNVKVVPLDSESLIFKINGGVLAVFVAGWQKRFVGDYGNRNALLTAKLDHDEYATFSAEGLLRLGGCDGEVTCDLSGC